MHEDEQVAHHQLGVFFWSFTIDWLSIEVMMHQLKGTGSVEFHCGSIPRFVYGNRKLQFTERESEIEECANIALGENRSY